MVSWEHRAQPEWQEAMGLEAGRSQGTEGHMGSANDTDLYPKCPGKLLKSSGRGGKGTVLFGRKITLASCCGAEDGSQGGN